MYVVRIFLYTSHKNVSVTLQKVTPLKRGRGSKRPKGTAGSDHRRPSPPRTTETPATSALSPSPGDSARKPATLGLCPGFLKEGGALGSEAETPHVTKRLGDPEATPRQKSAHPEPGVAGDSRGPRIRGAGTGARALRSFREGASGRAKKDLTTAAAAVAAAAAAAAAAGAARAERVHAATRSEARVGNALGGGSGDASRA
ncbi:uncharacterized protein PS065_018839 [Dugong dugon]